LAPGRPQCAPQADLADPLHDGDQRDVGDADRAHDERIRFEDRTQVVEAGPRGVVTASSDEAERRRNLVCFADDLGL
jgi:hypothetical protein